MTEVFVEQPLALPGSAKDTWLVIFRRKLPATIVFVLPVSMVYMTQGSVKRESYLHNPFRARQSGDDDQIYFKS